MVTTFGLTLRMRVRHDKKLNMSTGASTDWSSSGLKNSNVTMARTKTKAKTKAMTIKYWLQLSDGSRRRALTYVFPIHKSIVEMLMDQTPSRKDHWWQYVFKKVRIPEDGCTYKTVINNSIYLI